MSDTGMRPPTQTESNSVFVYQILFLFVSGFGFSAIVAVAVVVWYISSSKFFSLSPPDICVYCYVEEREGGLRDAQTERRMKCACFHSVCCSPFFFSVKKKISE